MLAPCASNALCPLKDVHETNRACILESKRSGQTEYAHSGVDNAWNIGWFVCGENNKRLRQTLRLEERAQLYQ